MTDVKGSRLLSSGSYSKSKAGFFPFSQTFPHPLTSSWVSSGIWIWCFGNSFEVWRLFGGFAFCSHGSVLDQPMRSGLTPLVPVNLSLPLPTAYFSSLLSPHILWEDASEMWYAEDGRLNKYINCPHFSLDCACLFFFLIRETVGKAFATWLLSVMGCWGAVGAPEQRSGSCSQGDAGVAI